MKTGEGEEGNALMGGVAILGVLQMGRQTFASLSCTWQK